MVSIRPSAPLAPALFSTMTGWFISLCLAMMPWMARAIWSDAPPALNGTTISTGFAGSQAHALAPRQAVAQAMAVRALLTILRCIFLSPLA